MKTFYILMKKTLGGRHKSYGNCTQDEKEFYADELDEAIHWDALAAAYDDF